MTSQGLGTYGLWWPLDVAVWEASKPRTPQGQQRLEAKSEVTSAGQGAGRWTNGCSLHNVAAGNQWAGQRALGGKADRNGAREPIDLRSWDPARNSCHIGLPYAFLQAEL